MLTKRQPQRRVLIKRIALLEAENRVLRERLVAISAWLGNAPSLTVESDRDDAARRVYRRVWMRRKRAKEKGAEAPLGE